nr:ficolin-2-like [Crassostrea gigas]
MLLDNGSPTDCTSLHNINCGLPSGLYRVRLPYIGHVTVFCEMEKDGGGWTVFQRRQDGSEDFYRTWTEYKNGFGNLGSEFWLGNDKLHNLLSQGTYEMRMDMEDFDNQTRYVKYSSFNVGNESSKYTVTSGFSGDVVVRVVGIIGQQQCVWGCRDRPKLCRGVDYQRQELLCELVSAINETEPKPDYVRIELDQTDRVPDECKSCSTDDMCVTVVIATIQGVLRYPMYN